MTPRIDRERVPLGCCSAAPMRRREDAREMGMRRRALLAAGNLLQNFEIRADMTAPTE
jgi:hypothetical protein